MIRLRTCPAKQAYKASCDNFREWYHEQRIPYLVQLYRRFKQRLDRAT
ncbi:MAG: hypothetical protein RMM98_09205 [Acidobacteriota bacterium]|nr:hypothetical protein [Acidobacteriota bacterium]